MKRLFTILSLGFFFIALSGCGTSEEDSSSEDQQNISNTETSEFFLNLPEDWRTFPQSTYTRNIVFAAQEPPQGDLIDTTIAVAVEHTIPFSLEQFTQKSLENIRQQSQDFYKIGEEKITLSNEKEAVLITFTDRNSLDMSAIGFYSLYSVNEEKNISSVVSISFDPLTSDGHKEFLKNILLSYDSNGKQTR